MDFLKIFYINKYYNNKLTISKDKIKIRKIFVRFSKICFNYH